MAAAQVENKLSQPSFIGIGRYMKAEDSRMRMTGPLTGITAASILKMVARITQKKRIFASEPSPQQPYPPLVKKATTCEPTCLSADCSVPPEARTDSRPNGRQLPSQRSPQQDTAPALPVTEAAAQQSTADKLAPAEDPPTRPVSSDDTASIAELLSQTYQHEQEACSLEPPDEYAEEQAIVAAAVTELEQRIMKLDATQFLYYQFNTDDRARLASSNKRVSRSCLNLLERKDVFRFIGPYTVSTSNILDLQSALATTRTASSTLEQALVKADNSIAAAKTALRSGACVPVQEGVLPAVQEAEAAFSTLRCAQVHMLWTLRGIASERCRPEYYAPRSEEDEETTLNHKAGLSWLHELVSECMRNTDQEITWTTLARYVTDLTGHPQAPAASKVMQMFGGRRLFKKNFSSWVRAFTHAASKRGSVPVL